MNTDPITPDMDQPQDELPEAPTMPEDTRPSRRPTTRAGRRAAAQAKEARAASSGDKAPKVSTPRKASLESRLANSLAALGTVVVTAGAATGSQPLMADGAVIGAHSANVAKAVCRVADENPQIKAALERMLTAGAWSGVVMAVMPVALAIGANHGALPPFVVEMLTGAPAAAPEPMAAAA